MARYTLNLSEVCETMTGQHFDNLTGNAFDRIDTISEAALPLLFSDRYDLLDNDTDRETLEKMILEHYWEYEICTYTPSDFILRLNRKLREIAPLYNQRYASAKMEYPVFDDVNYTRVSTNNDTYNETSGGSSIRNENGSGTDTETHSGSDTGTKVHTGTDTDTKTYTGKYNVSAADTGTDTFAKGSWESNSTLTETADATSTTSSHGESEGEITNWQYNNDTPENTVGGITNMDYLTSYGKTTSAHTGSASGGGEQMAAYAPGVTVGYNAQTGETTIQRNGQQTTLGAVSGLATGDKVAADSSGVVNQAQDLTQSDTHTGGSDSTTYGKTTTTTTDYDTTSHLTETTTHGYNSTSTDTTQHGHVVTAEHSKDYKTTDTDNRSKTSVAAGNDIDRITGKSNSGKTYAEMMQLYRKAMINIYNEIIEELHELFFLIY